MIPSGEKCNVYHCSLSFYRGRAPRNNQNDYLSLQILLHSQSKRQPQASPSCQLSAAMRDFSRSGLANRSPSQAPGLQSLLVFTDIFTGWVGGSPLGQKQRKGLKHFQQKSSLGSVCPTTFRATVAPHLQQKFPTSFYRYHLHSSWRPQSAGKIKQANRTLEKALGKLCQETSELW